LFLVTTNSYVRENNALTMGAGATNQAKAVEPGLDDQLGRRVKESAGHLGEYGLLLPESPHTIGAFQVKTH